MLEFILEYWLDIIFTLIVGGFSFWIKHDFKMWKNAYLASRNEFKEEIKQEIRSDLQQQIDEKEKRLNAKDKNLGADLEVAHVSLENLTAGLLSVQGRQFRADCLRLLDPNHMITIEEYEQLVEDHVAYNSLKGNHKGDALFSSVTVKFNNQNM